MLTLTSAGQTFAAIATKLSGLLRATLRTASNPSSCQTSAKSRIKPWLNAYLVPMGLPAGLPDTPGFHWVALLTLATWWGSCTCFHLKLVERGAVAFYSEAGGPLTRGSLLRSGSRLAGPEHDDFRADRRAVVEIDDVLVRQADAARRDVGANGPGFIGPVDAV